MVHNNNNNKLMPRTTCKNTYMMVIRGGGVELVEQFDFIEKSVKMLIHFNNNRVKGELVFFPHHYR